MKHRQRLFVRSTPLLLTVALAASLSSQSLWAQNRGFEDTTTVTVVEVPVQVNYDGAPLKTLTADQFEILDERKAQEIIGFEMVDLSTTSGIRDEVPIAARRHFVALFDLSFSQPDAIVRAREAAARLVLNNLHPTDLVSVATYSRSRGPQMVLGFTSDRRQIHHAISTLGLTTPAERVLDPLGLVISDISGELPTSAGSGQFEGTGIAELIEENAGDLQVMQGRVGRDQAKNQVLALVSSLEMVAQMLSSVQGRKHVLFLSEGFDSSILVGLRGSSNADQARIQEINQAAQDGEGWRVDSEERFGNVQAQSAMNQLLEAFRRADCTVQSIDIGGLVAGQENTKQAGLFLMANDTGGEMFTNYNDLGAAMSEMLERTSVTYLLAFQPKNLALNGSYHRLKVRLKDAPKGAEVVHRPGYYAPKPYAQQSALERRMQSAEKVLGGEPGGGIGTAVLSAAFDMPSGQSWAPVLVEVDGADLIKGTPDGMMALEIYAYALDDEGSVRDFFARKIGLDLSQARAALEQKGFKYWGHFDLDPGDYYVRVLVRNGNTGSSGVSVSEIKVPGADDPEPLLLPPFFPEPFDRWNWGREEQGDQRAGTEHPFAYGEEFFFPAARPQVPKGGRSAVSLVAYNLTPGALSVSCQAIDQAGAEVSESCSIELAGEPPVGDRLSRLPATFEAGKLRRGQYTLVVTLKNLATNEEQSSSIPIEIV